MQFHESFIDVPWGKMAVVCTGQPDDKPVLLIHGISDSGGTFVPLIQMLPNGFRFIMPDLPGCGHSDPFPTGRPLHTLDFVSPIKYVVDQLRLKDFIYIGHSMGAHLGLYFDAIYPNLIRKLVSLDSLTYFPVEHRQFANWFRHHFETFYNSKNYRVFNSNTETAPKYTYLKALDIVMKRRNLTINAATAVVKRCLIPTEDGLYRFGWDQRLKSLIVPPFSGKFQADVLGQIRVPYLTVFADQSVKNLLGSLKLQLFDEHRKNNPDYCLTLVQGNHDVHLNSPELVAPLVGNFIADGPIDQEETERTVEIIKKEYERQICKL